MNETAGLSTEAERFGWLERPDDDFPYYRGGPVGISTRGWLVVLAGVALGFLVLTLGPKLLSGVPAKSLIVCLYWAIPLGALALWRDGTGRRCSGASGASISCG
jgi:hypothetical protein